MLPPPLPSSSSQLTTRPSPSPLHPTRSEATIAKRRSYANTISYLTPPAENAGLYKGLKELKELIGSYQTLREGGRGEQICLTIIETAKVCNMQNDVKLPEDDEAAKKLTVCAGLGGRGASACGCVRVGAVSVGGGWAFGLGATPCA